MKKLLIGALAALTAVTGVMATTGPAQAYGGGYHGGYGGGGYRGGGYAGHGYGYGGWHGGGGGGAAIVAGLAGLAIGAAIAQPHYGYGYAAPAYYAPGYAYGPPAYYAGPTYLGWYGGCRREWVWSPRWGGYRLIGACY